MIMFERWWALASRNEQRYMPEDKDIVEDGYKQALDFVMTMFNTNLDNKVPIFDVEKEILAELNS